MINFQLQVVAYKSVINITRESRYWTDYKFWNRILERWKTYSNSMVWCHTGSSSRARVIRSIIYYICTPLLSNQYPQPPVTYTQLYLNCPSNPFYTIKCCPVWVGKQNMKDAWRTSISWMLCDESLSTLRVMYIFAGWTSGKYPSVLSTLTSWISVCYYYCVSSHQHPSSITP